MTAHAGGVDELGYRVVWCSNYRRPVLTGVVQVRCEELIRVKASEHGRGIVAVEAMPDHMRLFVTPDQSAYPASVANQFTGFISWCLRAELRHLWSTLWSRLYFVASVGTFSAATVRWHIDAQYERPWSGTRMAGS